MQLAQQLLEVSQQLIQLGLNKGTAGNISVRDGTGLLITPSGMAVSEMSTRSMVYMDLDGVAEAGKKPSSEWRFHRDIYQARPEINAVIHTHSMFATTIACMHKSIPAFHYMIALAGGDSIRCAPYALFGTQALSDVALTALANRKACLLAHHGMIAIGKDLSQTLAICIEVENLSEHYWRLLQLGEPAVLSDTEMQAVFEQFKDYRA